MSVHRNCDQIIGMEQRSGQWTTEEKLYASKLIYLFHRGNGYIGAWNGQSLRSFLAKALNCNPMRISKKYSNFKGLAHRFEACSNIDNIARHQAEVEALHAYKSDFYTKDIKVQTNRQKRKKNYEEKKAKKKLQLLTSLSSTSLVSISDSIPINVKESEVSIFENFDDWDIFDEL